MVINFFMITYLLFIKETYSVSIVFICFQGTVYGFVKKLEEKIGKNKVMCGDPVISIDQVWVK